MEKKEPIICPICGRQFQLNDLLIAYQLENGEPYFDFRFQFFDRKEKKARHVRIWCNKDNIRLNLNDAQIKTLNAILKEAEDKGYLDIIKDKIRKKDESND